MAMVSGINESSYERFGSSLTLDGETLYAGSANGKLYAISIE